MSQISTQSNASSRASPEPPSQVYLAQLHDHFADSRLHSLGSRNDDDPLLPSVFPPNAHWTSKEKDLFFHALAIHSRLRPDLIARDVKTKTLVDVCVYLDMLEEGLENLDDIKAQERSNQSKRKVKEFIRDELPIAMEMSEQWCHFEARQASLIAASEEKLHEIWLVQSHEAEVEAKRRELRAPKGGARDEQNKRDRRGEKMRGKEVQSWLKERKVEWEVEERLERLGADDLRALDMILRGTEVPTRVDDGDVDEGGDEGGGATNPANAQRLEQEGHLTQNKAQATLFSPCGPPGPSNVPPVGVPVLPNYLQLELGPRAPQDFLANNIPPVPTSFDESLIDPTLRGSSVHTLAPRPQTLVLANDTRDLHPDSNLLSHATFSHSQLLISGQPPSIIKPVLAPPAASITHPPVTRAQSWTRSSGFVADDTTADDAPSEEQALSLSPKSRRRLQKRMYMRRKRAQLTGRGVDTDPRKLKPGRKSYQASDDKQRVDPTMDEDGEHIDIDMTMESTVPNLDPATSVANVEAHTSRERLPSDETRKIGRHPHPSGLTRPYKARVELESIGMSTEVMKNEGLDLLRFSAFHRLTRMYQALFNSSNQMDPQVSFVLLKTLRAFVVLFVYEVTRRALMVRDQELRGKSQSRVWRYNGTKYVRRRDVKAALKLFGAEGLDKKKQFEVLLAHAQAGADERDQSEKGGNRENEDTVRDPSAEEADSDEISWLGDGEESDEERQADNGDESESSSEGSYLPSRGRSSTAGPSESGEGPSDQANLIQKSKFLESIPISRRVYPPFVRLPRAYLRHEDEGDYSDGQGRIGSLGSLSLTPWFLPAMAAGDRHATPPLITHQDLKNPVRQIAPSSASGSSYSPSSSDATNTSDVLSEDSDSDDAWATSEDNLEEKDVEQEIEYEKALWASYATDGVDDEQLGSNKQPPQEDVDDRWVCEKATRKRRSINDEEVRPDKDTGDMGFTGNEPKRKRTRRTLRGRKEQSSSEDDRDDSDELVDEWEPGNPLRYADPGMGRVKSAVYILDSD